MNEVGIVDLGISNIKSLTKVLDLIAVKYKKIEHKNDLKEVNKIIFPGVGSYRNASERLVVSGLMTGIQDFVNGGGSYLGICLGMQILSDMGYESGQSKGLGLVKGVTKKISATNEAWPHVGWNNFDGSFLSCNNPGNPQDFYFVNGYCLSDDDDQASYNYCQYGKSRFVATVSKGSNIFGVQFHPEKSQKDGVELIRNFIHLC